ncbi:Protein of unknown function (DUF2948) [Litoreibacter halocynthiae]|uniref:DUF2948 family protein n=1 Tax=Litoreibacter halocynthiae TaxID=1242689 RepID=A0A4R7LQJ5_9RHOB|nr:DUF2948 family protein [Litoreibacter halocynthiae]TDT77062.1 Protein of unknown function (DUF2948) [Litoreibacter halocynthiae]
MSRDASFEDGAERSLRLTAEDADDVTVISSLAQDAVFPVSEMAWKPTQRRFAVLLNRFRWEDLPAAERRGRDFERVRAVLAFDDVTKVSSSGLDRSDPEMVLSLLSIAWMAGEDGAGRFELTLAGDGAIALDAECVNITLQDVTRPYIAPSRKAPKHPE